MVDLDAEHVVPGLSFEVQRDDDAHGTGQARDEAAAEAELGVVVGTGSRKLGERGGGRELQIWYGKAGGDSGADSLTCMVCRVFVADIRHGLLNDAISAQSRFGGLYAVPSAYTVRMYYYVCIIWLELWVRELVLH